MHKKKFASSAEAEAYMKERGELKFYGRLGSNCEMCVYNLYLFDGRVFHVDIYDDGTAEVYPYGSSKK